MKNLLFDLHGQALRVLAMDGTSVVYRKQFDRFSLADAAGAAAVLDEVRSGSGMRTDRVHLVLPAGMVATATHQLPAMSAADAKKVLQRKLPPGADGRPPVFGIIPAAAGRERQSFIVETIPRDQLASLIASFRDLGVSVRTVATSLPANLKALELMPADPSATMAHLDLENEQVELCVRSGGQLLFHATGGIPPLSEDKELESGKSPERIMKMRLYRTVESVYAAYVAYQNDYPDLPLSRLWISGAGCALDGIGEVLKESTGVDAQVLNAVGPEADDGYAFTALAGLQRALLDDTVVNHLPKELAGPSADRTNLRTAAAVAAILLLGVLSFGIELRRDRINARFEAVQQEVLKHEQDLRQASAYGRHRPNLVSLVRSEPALYPVFAYLADHTPDGVFISGLTFNHRSGAPTVEIEFLVPSLSELGSRKLLTKVTAMLDGTSGLRRKGEPVLSVSRRDKSADLRFKILCEVAL